MAYAMVSIRNQETTACEWLPVLVNEVFLLEHSQAIHLHTVYGSFLTTEVTTGTIHLMAKNIYYLRF